MVQTTEDILEVWKCYRRLKILQRLEDFAEPWKYCRGMKILGRSGQVTVDLQWNKLLFVEKCRSIIADCRFFGQQNPDHLWKLLLESNLIDNLQTRFIIISLCRLRYANWTFSSGSIRLCGLVVRVSGYRYRGLGFDSRRYQIFWVAVCLERGPLSLVRSTEELLE